MSETRPTWEQMIDTVESMTPAELKAAMPPSPTTKALVAHFPELALVEVRDLTIEGPHGDRPARSYRLPGDGGRAALVWAHGGGFIAGDLDMPEAHWVALMVAARGIPVLSFDYAKCLHGTRYPVPSDDALAVWQWAAANADRLGTTAGGLHLGGASAGANLVAGVAKRLRDTAGPMPRSVILAYPLVHAELPQASDDLAAVLVADPTVFTAQSVHEIALNYGGVEATLDDPYAFAANGDLSGQPPHLILNSETDSLRASGEAYAAALESAGVAVVVEYEPNTAHGHLNEPEAPSGALSIGRIVRWIDGHSPGVIDQMT